MPKVVAVALINGDLYEEGQEHGFFYEFGDLLGRFEPAWEEAILEGDDFLTIKIPSFYELNFETKIVGTALGRSGRVV